FGVPGRSRAFPSSFGDWRASATPPGRSFWSGTPDLHRAYACVRDRRGAVSPCPCDGLPPVLSSEAPFKRREGGSSPCPPPLVLWEWSYGGHPSLFLRFAPASEGWCG